MDPHVEAIIRYLRPDEGGRSSAIYSGYRGQFHYEGESDVWDAPQTFVDTEFADPGDTVKVHLSFLSPQEHHPRIAIGVKFDVREGDRLVGEGEITKIFSALRRDALAKNETAT